MAKSIERCIGKTRVHPPDAGRRQLSWPVGDNYLGRWPRYRDGSVEWL